MRVLIVEDDPAQRELLARVLVRLGCEIVEASTVQQANSAPGAFDLAIVDYELPDGTARDIDRMGTRMVVLSGYDKPREWKGEWIVKPYAFSVLRDLIRGILP